MRKPIDLLLGHAIRALTEVTDKESNRRYQSSYESETQTILLDALHCLQVVSDIIETDDAD